MEQFDQTRFFGFIQARQPSRATCSPQSKLTALLVFFPPPADCLVVDLQPPADLAIIEVVVEQFDRHEPRLLQCHNVTLHTSRIIHAD